MPSLQLVWVNNSAGPPCVPQHLENDRVHEDNRNWIPGPACSPGHTSAPGADRTAPPSGPGPDSHSNSPSAGPLHCLRKPTSPPILWLQTLVLTRLLVECLKEKRPTVLARQLEKKMEPWDVIERRELVLRATQKLSCSVVSDSLRTHGL